jgi:hypothetical protein
MDVQHLDLKIPLAGPQVPDLGALIPVFHRWVRERVFDEQLIDVADYRHVPEGPGVLVVGHDSNYSLDLTDGRPGLRYVRKTPVSGGNQAALAQALRALDSARRLLEGDESLAGSFTFSRHEIEVRINDRLLAPNRQETFAQFEPELTRFFGESVGSGMATLEYSGPARTLFCVTVRSPVPIELSAPPAVRPS